MNIFKKKLKEWAYSISTEDHYAEYDPDEVPSFNMGMRSGQGAVNPSSMNLAGNGSASDLPQDEMDIGNRNGDYNIEDYNAAGSSQKGVSEAMLAWRHIELWTDEHNPDLNATLSDPCTQNDITHAEEDLEVSLPPSVKASLRIHDGQEDLESMTGTSGLIYGLQLMTIDQIVAMTQAWRNVAKNLNKHKANNNLSNKSSNASGGSSQQLHNDNNIQQTNKFKLPYIPDQSSIPPEAVQAAYAHPAWIPLVTDNAGNHIGVDLAPGPNGSYGQVIIFGREFDVKYVVSNSWGEFLLSFANDLEAGNWYFIDDSDDYFSGEGELVFRDKKSNGVVQEYLEVLKKRIMIRYNESLQAKDTQDAESNTTQTANENNVDNDTDFELDDESINEQQSVQTIEKPVAPKEEIKYVAPEPITIVKEEPKEEIKQEEEETKAEEPNVDEEPKAEEPNVEEEKEVCTAQAEEEDVKGLQKEFETVAL